MSKRTIVLGGAGLIGSHLCVKLLEKGYEVVCIDKRGRRESPLLRNIENRDRFHYIKHDITTPYEIGCDELFNLASPIEYGDSFDYIDDQRLISYGAINSLENLIGSNTKVLFGSSDDIYNFDRLDVKYKSPNRFVSDSKRFGESLHRAYNSHHKIDVRIARIFSTYGSNAGLRDQHVISKMIVQALNNHDITINGKGDQLRTFCWVDDMADGLIKLMSAHSNSRIITADLGSVNQISIRQLAELIISLTGSKSNIYHAPAKIDEPRYKIPDLKIAQQQLHWEATTTLREGLLRTISYIEKELSSIAMSQMSWVEIYG
ncbi:MAG: NAD-dependent epimerase/dehydratase family protein [Rikenellaceae bacterium]